MKAYAIYNTPENDLNLYYWGRFSSPDAFFALKIENKTFAFVSELEYGRCKQMGCFDEVFLWSEVKKHFKEGAFWPSFFSFLQEKYAIDTFVVPDDFPAFIYSSICKIVNVEFDEVFFKLQRTIKTNEEISEIKKACRLTADTISFARGILSESRVVQGVLYWKDKILTSEHLRSMMEIYCLERGGYSAGTIVACGEEAANPHCQGSGPIQAHQLIVIDFFPRLQSSHYYGDMTRTFVKGKASTEQLKLYHCVLECQRALISRIRAGVLTSHLQTFVLDFFEKHGYGLRRMSNTCEGFIHSVGHGLGLDLHEYPSVGAQPIELKPGMVITVEPGLYFKSLGGVRIEDDVCVTENGCEILSSLGYELEI